MERAFAHRKSNDENSSFSKNDVDNIVKRYAKKNMTLAAATSIVPGPFGILGSIPELLLNFGNQMNMIYDLGCAYNKENFINKDILLDIPIAAFGGNTKLSKIQNNTTDLIDSANGVLLEKASTLGRSVIDRTLKKSVVQFIPVAGPILMGTWAKMTTKKIAACTINFLSVNHTYIEHVKPLENSQIQLELQKEKIMALANLIEANDEINKSQIELIGTIIENSDLTDTDKEYLLEESLKTGSRFELNNLLIKEYEEDDDLIMQLIIMAKRTGTIDNLERNYIYDVGHKLGVDKEIITELF